MFFKKIFSVETHVDIPQKKLNYPYVAVSGGNKMKVLTTRNYTGRFVMFTVIINIYNKKTKGPTLMEFFTATGKLKSFFFF